MENRKDERIPLYIQQRMKEEEYECVLKYVEDQDPISLFDAWKKRGYPNVETVNKMIW